MSNKLIWFFNSEVHDFFQKTIKSRNVKTGKSNEERNVSHSVMSDSATPWTVVHQFPLSMDFSRQEYWSWWSFPSPRHFPHSGIKPGSPALQADSLPSAPPGKPNPMRRITWIKFQVQNQERRDLKKKKNCMNQRVFCLFVCFISRKCVLRNRLNLDMMIYNTQPQWGI